jgi:hypothetical protein
MLYHVRFYVEDKDPVPNPVGVVGIGKIPIEKTQYEKVKQSQNTCLLALEIEERCQFVIDNYAEWETELLKQAQEFLLWETTRHDSLQRKLTLDRRLSNFLMALRLYHDQTEKNISEAFGSNSMELQRIRDIKSKLYDEHLGYRFLEVLRNHVQHCSLAVRTISFRSGVVERHPKSNAPFSIQFSVAPLASFESLVSNKDFKKSILDEIKSHGEEIDLRPHVRAYVSCIVKLHGEVRKAFLESVNEAKAFYSSALEKYSVINGNKTRHPRLEQTDERENVVETVHLFPEILTDYETLHHRNSRLTDVTKSFASNAIAQ